MLISMKYFKTNKNQVENTAHTVKHSKHFSIRSIHYFSSKISIMIIDVNLDELYLHMQLLRFENGHSECVYYFRS